MVAGILRIGWSGFEVLAVVQESSLQVWLFLLLSSVEIKLSKRIVLC